MNNELLIWEKISFYICCFLSMLVPIPLFFDGLTGGLVLQKTSFPVINQFPIPVGLLAFVLIFLIFYLNALLFKNDYKFLIEDKRNRKLLFFISFFILFWAVFMANNEFFRVVQLVLPPFLLLLVAFPVHKRRVGKIVYFYLISFFVFNATHLTYINLNSEIFNVTEFDYALYWGYGIYQAFVSYPGVLGLFFALVSFLFFIEKNLLLKFLLLLFWFVLIVSLGLAARRISLFEMMITVFMILIFIALNIILRKGVIRKNYFLSFFVYLASFLFVFLFYFKMPIFSRAVDSAKTNSFDSGRFDIYHKAIDFLSSDYYFLIFGYGGKSGFHNYFLDIIFSVGLFPFLISIFILVFFFKRRAGFSITNINFYLFLAVIGCFLLQSMLNASITQPLYLCNFIMIILVVIFYTDFDKKLNSGLAK